MVMRNAVRIMATICDLVFSVKLYRYRFRHNFYVNLEGSSLQLQIEGVFICFSGDPETHARKVDT